jgi:sugar transferase (PEP-CTERM/EpsH1 system associated)
VRLLFLTARVPGRFQGDRVRAYHQLRLLSRDHRITLLTFGDARADAPALGALGAFCARVVTVPLSPARMARALLRGGLAGRPLQVALYEHAAMRAAVAGALHAGTYDLAHVQLVRMAAYLDALRPLPRVLDLIDALSVNMARRARHDRGAARWLAGLEARRLAAYERAAVGAADRALVGSPLDREALGSPPGLTVVTSGVDPLEFPYQPDGREPDTVVFTGNLGYFPNVQAVRWLAEAVLPPLARAVPGIRLRVVGARPHRSLLRLARREPRIAVSADVADVGPHLRRAAVAVAPMRAGSGQQLKILEAMASGTPVVATALAADGLPAGHGDHLLVADEPEAFAGQVVRVLREPALARALAESGRRLVEARHTWERSGALLEDVYRSVLAGPRP